MSPADSGDDGDSEVRAGVDRRTTPVREDSTTRDARKSDAEPRHAEDADPFVDRDPTDARAAETEPKRSTLVNGLVGALVTVLLFSVVPFAPLFGGLVAGYLEGRDVAAGVLAGLVAGVLAAIVAVFGALAFGTFMLGFAAMGGGPALFGALFVLLFFVGMIYTVGFALVGGALGAYLNREFGDDIGRV